MKKLISFIMPSRRLENVRGFFDNIEKTAHDPNCVEVLIKFDDDQEGVKEFIEAEVNRRSFTIKYLITPRVEGVYSVWIGIERLFFMTSPDSYFIQIISDEPRFLTPHWDLVLRKYIHFFKDDVFRLRLSVMKFANYSSHYECTFRPDSFAIYTRRWLELTEGTGDCWGSDAYQQCVAFHLSLGPGSYHNIYRRRALCRDMVVYDIELGGLEFGVGVSRVEQRDRHKRNLKEWNRLTTHFMQEHFSYLARRIYCYIWANEQGISEFKIVKNSNRRTVSIIASDGQEAREISYAVPRWIVFFQNMTRHIITFPRRVGFLFLKCYLKILKTSLKAGQKYENEPSFNARKEMYSKKEESFKCFLIKARITLCVPFNVLFYIMSKPFTPSPPGISVLNSRKMNLPKWVKKPNSDQITWLRKELDSQHDVRNNMKNKVFCINKQSRVEDTYIR